MKKSIYSLVLMDDVIRAVDEEACRLGTSRSNLINQILAERLSCITPEMRMREIFGSLAALAESGFLIQQQRSASLMTLRTALEYKYRPTVNYRVELLRMPDSHIGTLKVHIRTQNERLISLFNAFFVSWMQIEAKNFHAAGLPLPDSTVSSGCFTRSLINSQLSEEAAGNAINSYISLLDKAVKLYFAAPQSFPSALPKLASEHMVLIQNTII